MIDASVLPAFVFACLALTITPGANMFLILRTTAQSGIRGGVWTLAGLITADALLATVVASGLSLVFLHNPDMLSAVRWVGAAYLLYLAGSLLHGLWRARHNRSASLQNQESTGDVHTDTRSCYMRGLVCNVTNPKSWLFCLAITPHFIGDASEPLLQFALLGATYVVSSLVCPSTILVAASRFAKYLRRTRTKQWVDGVSATVFLALSASLVSL